MQVKSFVSERIIVLASVTVLLLSLSIIFELSTWSVKKANIQLENKKVNSEQYKKITKELTDIVQVQDPKIALLRLQELIRENEEILNTCHSMAHEVGHSSFNKLGFAEAMRYQDEVCNSGYIHGIIESYFADNFDPEAISEVCESYNPESFLGHQCNHGIGHGFMFVTENDLPKSLDLCSTLINKSAQNSCVNGVFMENFNTDQKIHVSDYLDESNPFYPCPIQKKEHKFDCYLYSPTYFLSINPGKYSSAFDWCATADQDYVTPCIRGVAAEAMKQNINHPLEVESLCTSLSQNYVPYCLYGMINLYMNHFGSTTEARELCPRLKIQHQKSCLNQVEERYRKFSI